jgi:hypothetical protein
LEALQAALQPEVSVVLRRTSSFPYDLEQLALEQTVRGTLVRRARELLVMTDDAKARADLLAALKFALMALDGRQVHPDAIE